ncbi:MAG: LOG family protein [bacterium]
MISKITPNYISFKSNNTAAPYTSYLNENYTTQQRRANTVAILGGSRSEGSAKKYMGLCERITKKIVQNGKDAATGCGTNGGIMKASFFAAAEASKKDETGKPIQNLALLTLPRWVDENTKDCVVIGELVEKTRAIDGFAKVADTILVFPGRATTTEEVTTIIRKNDYKKPAEELDKIILVGKKYWENFKKHYENLYKSGDLTRRPDELFVVVNSEKQILKKLGIADKPENNFMKNAKNSFNKGVKKLSVLVKN